MPRDAHKDFMIMCDLLRRLVQLSGKCWRNEMNIDQSKLTQETKDNYHALIKALYPVKAEDLEKLIKENSTSNCLSIDKFYLPPLDADKEFIPVLSLECDFGNTPPTVGLRIGMFRYCGNGTFRVFVFRFETGITNSNHDYCHGQFTSKPFRNVPSGWPHHTPETYPCVITPAKCPVSLIFCMLISFYGKRIASSSIFSDLNIDIGYKEPLRYLCHEEA